MELSCDSDRKVLEIAPRTDTDACQQVSDAQRLQTAGKTRPKDFADRDECYERDGR